MDVHHINGLHWDDSPDNLQLLCSNCHRIVTKYMRRRRYCPTPEEMRSSKKLIEGLRTFLTGKKPPTTTSVEKK